MVVESGGVSLFPPPAALLSIDLFLSSLTSLLELVVVFFCSARW